MGESQGRRKDDAVVILAFQEVAVCPESSTRCGGFRCYMNIIRVAFALCTLCRSLFGASFRDDFAVVFIDAASEAKFGAFPLDRSLLARAIQKASDLHARGVVLKFFLDQPKAEASDLLLAQALTNTPVLLQARIDDSEAHPNPLPARFTLQGVKFQTQISGRGGWIPIPRFMANAHDVGFVDFSSTQVPLVENYQDRPVKSLVLCCIELATGKRAIIEPGQKLTLGAHELRLDARNCVQAKLPLKDDLAYIPFQRFLAGDIPANLIQGKVVIVGYDGPKMYSISTPIGQVRAHRLFVYELQSIYEQLCN
jgi:hypothetical protein